MTLAERAAPGAFVRVLDWTPPAAGAEMMGTGIMSVALSLDGDETLSRILLAIAGVTWLMLAAVVVVRGWCVRARFRPAVVDRVPRRHVRRMQLRRRGGCGGRGDHRLRARMGLDRGRRVGVVLVAMLYRGVEAVR